MSREAAGFGFESWVRERMASPSRSGLLHSRCGQHCLGAVWGEKVTGHRWSLRNTDIEATRKAEGRAEGRKTKLEGNMSRT